MTDARANMDADIDAQDVAGLVSADALAGFFQRLGYDTSRRAALAAEAIGISDADGAFRRLELISEDPEGLLRVVLAQVRSVTAKARNDLVRALGGSTRDHSIVLTSDFRELEFVLIDKVKRHRPGPAAVTAYKPVPRVYSVQRKAASSVARPICTSITTPTLAWKRSAPVTFPSSAPR